MACENYLYCFSQHLHPHHCHQDCAALSLTHLPTHPGGDLYLPTESIMAEPGFYICFEPLPGAIEAMNEMLAEGIDVRLCTAPHPLQYETW